MMENGLKTTDDVPAQTDRTLATWRLMMQGYRQSYWKTVLAVGAAMLMCASLASTWVITGQIDAPGFILTSLQHPIPFWTLIAMVGGCALAGAVVVSGGVICLYREWRQYR